jgi:hypothetical protein
LRSVRIRRTSCSIRPTSSTATSATSSSVTDAEVADVAVQLVARMLEDVRELKQGD